MNLVLLNCVVGLLAVTEGGSPPNQPRLRAGEGVSTPFNVLLRLSPLINEGIKPTIVVRENDDPNNPRKDLDVIVKETPTGSFMVGVGVNSDSGLISSIASRETPIFASMGLDSLGTQTRPAAPRGGMRLPRWLQSLVPQ